MRTLQRSPSTAVIFTGTAELATAPPASAASYHCKTSTTSVDDAAYEGFWAEDASGYGHHQFAASPIV
ncbi:hypothetical protein AB0N81_34700 [Streptomyces sp. NPDC093510]|uniref:hypothetical protein n=1 Tax=Streptomyces sp. NPDC093510 TaxID=3155199 RepID=UPI0034413DE3